MKTKKSGILYQYFNENIINHTLYILCCLNSLIKINAFVSLFKAIFNANLYIKHTMFLFLFLS